ncbi:DUF2442 domain-containing protein [Sandaracinobacteroides saxicola]|uniref:DUF2442 domain-containing protein n=1 Tax=Sandaracinobacteroides saxicola TaxID=2759707 RepID=A0A7G5IES0_9SPHN|nr:DUF2442 domain-containing protein [Sandaracinobacteroides saxicola]QMW21862.1 DUF2442 domain-containing protein [Sandaracinobacteroides saxicola]
MVEVTDAAIERALQAGAAAEQAEPRAQCARYDEGSDRVIVDLTNGATFAFPPALVQGLAGANVAELADVTVAGGGFGLHWAALDVDYSVPGLVNGVFGTARWMAARAGRATSAAKAAASRANGMKGGRPRRAAGSSA